MSLSLSSSYTQLSGRTSAAPALVDIQSSILFVHTAVLHKAVPVAAAVVEFAGGPTAWVTRTYTASKGAGAQCNGKDLRVTTTSDITQSLLV